MIGPLKIEQAAKETVVFGVADLRTVQDMIVVVVLLYLIAQAENLFFCFFPRWAHASFQ